MVILDVNSRVGIPKGIREKLGLIKGESDLDIFERNGEIVLVPIVETFRLSKEEMEIVRKLYFKTQNMKLIPENEMNILKKACNISDILCPSCGASMYYTKDKKYECPKCSRND